MKSITNILKNSLGNFSFFYSHLGYRVFVSVILSLALGVLDGFGLSMFLPLLQMINDTSAVDPETLGKLRFIVDGLEALGFDLTLVVILMVMVFFFIMKGIAKFSTFAYRVHVQQFFMRKIRLNMLDSLNKIKFSFFLQSDVGRIQNTLSGEVERVSRAYNSYFGALQQFILMLVYMGFAFFVDLKFAFLVSAGGALTNILYRVIYKKTKAASRKLTADANLFQGLIIQHVNNFKYLKATGRLAVFAKKIIKVVYDIENSNRKIGMLGAILQSAREPLMIFVVSAVIYIQSEVLGASLGPIIISLLFFYRALTSLTTMQDRWNVFLSTSGSMENMTNFQILLDKNVGDVGEKKFTTLTDKMEFKGLDFSYSSETPILKKLSLTINKNETVAIVGESGSGKTTALNIISGLLDSNVKGYFIDGVNSQEFDIRTFQNRIGYITQEPVIFSDTIYNNITFWSDLQEGENSDYQRVKRQAAIDKFINTLPEKDETVLGNNGVNLSGGQKQRLSIARELYKDIDILLMDEATSALDSETEKTIKGNIVALKGKYTILIIAHRLSTVKHADKVIVLKEGQVESMGTYTELLNNSSTFKRMVELQEL